MDIGSNMFLYYQDLEFSKTVLDLRTPPAILKISASSYQLQPYGFKVFSYNQENFFLLVANKTVQAIASQQKALNSLARVELDN